MEKINLKEKLSLFDAYWQPHVVGELNGQYLKLVKFKGPFTWHHHDDEDELFFVVKGRFRMEFREEDESQENAVWIEEGEMITVPRGVEHRPVADEEAHVLLFEPVSTLNTGNVENEFTVPTLKKV
jgi:mannose-6-phosphate isomerase-like protein (cupin superfamily)